LMELVVLNIGLQYGLIAAPLFSAMVIMALATTFIATPLFLASQRPSTKSASRLQTTEPLSVGQGSD
jgi:Kef-type K+ transport system membrane component KefB